VARLRGQVALVTGASSGIGKAIAFALAAEGADVAVVARRGELLRKVADGIREQESGALAFLADITDPAAVDAAFEAVIGRFGHLDILVNNAGGNVPRRSLAEVTVESWRAVVDLNLTGAFLCTRAGLRIMRSQGRGTIINIASWAGRRPAVLSGPAYSAAKAGLIVLNQSINLEERRHGIRACVILPGEVDTPIMETRLHPPLPAARATMLQPEDVAAAVVFVTTLPHRATVEEVVIQPTVLRNQAEDWLAVRSTAATKADSV